MKLTSWELRVTPSKNKKYKFIYEVIDRRGKVYQIRKSNNDYSYAFKDGPKFRFSKHFPQLRKDFEGIMAFTFKAFWDLKKRNFQHIELL